MTPHAPLTYWLPQLIELACQNAHEDGAHDLAHLHRVWRNACALLAASPSGDVLVVLAACYLHDVVNLPKDHPARATASRLSALEAVRRLRAVGFPTDKLPAVAHAIEAHSFSANVAPTTLEARIVQDADRLDALGAVGLARMFYIAGRMGSALAHPSDAAAEARVLDDRTYALDHIAIKLAKLPDSLHTEAARALGRARLARLLAFRDDFLEEWG
jgi:uncharacterized protein